MKSQSAIGNQLKQHQYVGDLYLFYAALSLILLSGVSNELRYAKYLVIFPIIVLFIQNGKIFLRPYLYSFGVILFFGFLELYFWNLNAIKEVFFILCGIGFFVFSRPFKINVVLVNFTVLLVFLAYNINNMGEGISISFYSSVATYEGYHSFVFAFFAIYFLVQKRYFWFFLNVLFVLVSLKRIAFLGVLACVVIWFLPKKIRSMILNPFVMITLNAVFLIISVMFAEGVFDEVINEFFGLSANALTQGRQVLYKDAADFITNNVFGLLFLGVGPGAAYEFTYMAIGEINYNLHNDVMKLFIEYGGIAFFLFFYFLYSQKSDKLKIVGLFFNILLLTDNVIIYTYILFFYCMVCAIIYYQEKLKLA